MIKQLKQLDISKLLFVDGEMVAGQSDLCPTKDEALFNAVSWKYRDYTTGEEKPAEEVIKDYKQKAALHPPYGKIACLTVGYVYEGTLRVKTFRGEEEQIIRDFYKISEGRVLVGYNSNRFDLEYCKLRGWKYGISVPFMLDTFEKKPWDLNIEAVLKGTCGMLDLMDIVKGTFAKNFSLEDCCILFGIPTSKDGDVKGSEVSHTYYNVENGLDLICKYCERDVLAAANLFLFLRGEDLVDFSEDYEPPKSLPLPEKIYTAKNISDEHKQELRDMLSKKKLTKKDKQNLKSFLVALTSNVQGFIADKDAAQKEEMINEFIKTL